MAAVDNRKVRQALRDQLLTVGGLSTVNWENQPFTPPAIDELWIKERFMPGTERGLNFGFNWGIGRVQYSVLFGEGQGTEAAEDAATSIAAAFEPGTLLNTQGVTIEIDRLGRSPSSAWDELWLFIPVIISWRTYVLSSI